MANATASEIVANPNLVIDPITAYTASKIGYTTDELRHFRIGHDDIYDLVIEIYNFTNKKGALVKKDLREFVSDAVFEDSIDKTPTFTLSVHDPDWELLNTGALEHNIDLNPGKIPNRWYRLTSFNVNDDDLDLIFETRNAVYLAGHKTPRKANRKHITRAQFILALVRSVKKTKIKFFCPQLKKKQKVGKTRFGSQTERKNSREKGFSESDKITVKHAPATAAQRSVIEQIIAAGVDVDSPGLVIVAAIMTVIQESNASNHPQPPNPPYIGAFQQNPQGWPATANAYKDAKGFYNAAIPRFKRDPNQDLGMFAQLVQGADPNLNPLNSGYAQSANRWRDEAQHAVNAYGGIEVGDTPASQEFKKKYEFMVGPDDGPLHENYLAATYRLAEDVNWSAFWVADVLHYQSEEDLFKSQSRARLRRFEDGIESIQFGWDRQKKVNTMTLSVRMEKWVAPIGTVVNFDEGGPARGRWLITNIRRSMFSELGEVTLSKPMREKVEPANDPGTREPNIGGPGGTPSSDQVGDAGGTLADIKTNWTAKQVIDKLVVPKAKAFGMLSGTTVQGVVEANGRHGGTSETTWHKGPSEIQWASDMSNGFKPTPEMDNLANELIMAFDLVPLEKPNASPADGYVPGNLTDTWHKGFHFQLIYRTNLGASGGDHYNHVHFGVKKEGPRPFHMQNQAGPGDLG